MYTNFAKSNQLETNMVSDMTSSPLCKYFLVNTVENFEVSQQSNFQHTQPHRIHKLDDVVVSLNHA